MKIVIPLILCSCLPLFGQEFEVSDKVNRRNEQVLFVSIGKPWFPDKTKNLKNFSFSANYHLNFSKNFAIEPFYLYAQSNSYPKFYKDEQKRDAFIRQQEYFDFYHAHWEDIYNHSLGVKVHFSFINNNQWYFSFNLAGGYYTSKSTIHYITESQHDPQTLLLTYYKIDYFKAINNGFFTMPGMQIQYKLGKGFIIGIELYSFIFRDTKDIWQIYEMPVAPSFYNVSFIIGKNF